MAKRVDLERGCRFLRRVIDSSVTRKPRPLAGHVAGKPSRAIARDILMEQYQDPTAVLLAAQVVAMEELTQGAFPGVNDRCIQAYLDSGDTKVLGCVALQVLLRFNRRDGVTDDVLCTLKSQLQQQDCYDHCSENPDPDFRLKVDSFRAPGISYSSISVD